MRLNEVLTPDVFLAWTANVKVAEKFSILFLTGGERGSSNLIQNPSSNGLDYERGCGASTDTHKSYWLVVQEVKCGGNVDLVVWS